MAEPKLKLPFQIPEFHSKTEQDGANRKRLYVLLAILTVLVLGALGLNYALNNSGETALVPPDIPNEISKKTDEDLVQILPQLERVSSEGQKEEYKGLFDPFSPTFELSGIITGDSDLAILKVQQVSYIISPGEKIADTWELAEVNRNSVVLKNENREITVELTTRK